MYAKIAVFTALLAAGSAFAVPPAVQQRGDAGLEERDAKVVRVTKMETVWVRPSGAPEYGGWGPGEWGVPTKNPKGTKKHKPMRRPGQNNGKPKLTKRPNQNGDNDGKPRPTKRPSQNGDNKQNKPNNGDDKPKPTKRPNQNGDNKPNNNGNGDNKPKNPKPYQDKPKHPKIPNKYPDNYADEDPNAEPDDYQAQVLYHHNVHRSNHSAADLTWSADLASIATDIANTCQYAHNTTAGGGGYGQNIAAGVPADDIGRVISDMFYNSEVGYFKGMYGKKKPTGFHTWGHFSQIVWKKTTTVGCASVLCSSLGGVGPAVKPWFTVCNYGPPGNLQGAYAKNIGRPLGRKTVTA
ncbi:hypothetical protein LTR37_016449 [Vermiconidia calcicola]|uniref:Uncharacterized protein n=1 Tax=Vermiconidia calcicola TaxID=1690605 RepID=A0ACC3MN83_9PEZI|nr:hypothetical protein LTR37_016449 [Vermiconidia calcicola]